MITSELFQVNQEIQWQDAGKGIQRQIFGHDDAIMMVKVKFEKGAIGEVHAHHQVQVSYVESGIFKLLIGNETKILTKGDGYYVPPNVLHGCECLKAGTLIDVFTPHRPDFLVNE
ncbi:cupin domain-containing protein [Olivibacter ginsenosidimutans]|uniref:Cupin domain-containing protein n=1 Tax=Olivibacter ginsenosidimutans TaxID=1176537 RepID=A0ABP9CDW9_9SPHI